MIETIRGPKAGVYVALAFLAMASQPALAQLDQTCFVSALNRTARVQPDGTWVLPNVPANQGPVRVRANCVDDGVLRSGQSDFVIIPPDGVLAIDHIELAAPQPIPIRLGISSSATLLTAAGQTVQLTTVATYPGGGTANVTPEAAGTSYRSSNPAIATVDAGGLVTARTSGAVLVSALNEGALAVVQLQIVTAGDTDGDGLPDDWEIANGLDPNNPADAFKDQDADGLSTIDEFQRGLDPFDPDGDGDGLLDGEEVATTGTNPALFDTDGDGLSDGLEVRTGSDPLDPASFNLAAALASLEVLPARFTLVVNTLIGEASRQLTVRGTLIDGTTIDLTSTARGTQYGSSDLTVCNFGAEPGRIFAGSDGVCTVTVSVGGRSAGVEVTVRSFSPRALGYVDIPGFANAVDVEGDYAFVAAGDAGLQVVDVADRSAPVVVASLGTTGNANNVWVAGNRAYVADGAEGLVVVDVTDPRSPQRLGGVVTPGGALDVAVRGNLAVVADGSAGLAVIDVSDPAAPVILGSLPVAEMSVRGVDLSADGRRAVAVADGSGGGGTDLEASAPGDDFLVVDLTTPSAPVLLGSTDVGDPYDVVLSGSFAVVASLFPGMTTVDLSDPVNPVVLATAPQDLGGLLKDVALAGSFAFGADIFFVNGVPIVDVSDPATPTPRDILDFSAFRDDDGTGVAVDATYVYLTAVQLDSRLYIGQYLELQDDQGVPPTVRITDPAPGSSVIEGARLVVRAEASDDVAVAQVEFLVDGQPVLTDTAAPYEATIEAPAGVASVTLGARAVDFGDNVGTATDVPVTVLPDPRTTAAGLVVDRAGAGVAGADVKATGGVTGTTVGDGSFALPGVPTVRGDISVAAEAVVGGVEMVGRSPAVAPVPGGTTDVGTIALAPAEGCVTGVVVLSDERCFEPLPTLTAVEVSSPLIMPVELLVRDENGQFVPAGEVTPDPNDGSFCANLRRDKVYLLRRRDIFCCGQTTTCQTVTGLTDPNAEGACGGAGASCQDLGEVTLQCDFDDLFCGS